MAGSVTEAGGKSLSGAAKLMPTCSSSAGASSRLSSSSIVLSRSSIMDSLLEQFLSCQSSCSACASYQEEDYGQRNNENDQCNDRDGGPIPWQCHYGYNTGNNQ